MVGILKWADTRSKQESLAGRLITWDKNGDTIYTIKDFITHETLMLLPDVINFEENADEIRFDCETGGIILTPINIPIKCITKNRDKINVGNGCYNTIEFMFNKEISYMDFIVYLITTNQFPERKYEPGSIMISRSKENPNTIVYREELIK